MVKLHFVGEKKGKKGEENKPSENVRVKSLYFSLSQKKKAGELNGQIWFKKNFSS